MPMLLLASWCCTQMINMQAVAVKTVHWAVFKDGLTLLALSTSI